MTNGPRTDRAEHMDDHARVFELERDMDHNDRLLREREDRFLKLIEELSNKVKNFNRIGISILVTVCGALILLVVQIATGR